MARPIWSFREVSGRFSRNCHKVRRDKTNRNRGFSKMDIQVGDVLKLKKQHPCGSKEWEVLRIGADFRLKCMGCGHQIMIARRTVEKNIREIMSKD